MTTRNFFARSGAAAAGAVVLLAIAGTAHAEEISFGDSPVDVGVTIEPLTTPGALTLTVAGTSASLAEDGSTALVRQFTGTLPTVTVSDTRAPQDVPSDAAWYVLGSASDFVGDSGQPAIGAENLGWAPRLIDGGDSGLVAAGDPVLTADGEAPNNTGLQDQELFVSTGGSRDVVSEGSWTATADLTLRVPSDVDPGDYSSVLTLSLFE
ncbi:hypothetical protein [Microbacterium sp. Leaf151]|uniref:hypothetical protein n=1 Tax=Microbacterium sp. Leaf151 TaxID=1736276 RepID=UPI0007003860|nr:hypothetical protein [Microbacterium sp. Leaf151]KQR26400.1 hypothetical protein ASF76_03980 [Microbacterium sp. Leaf151]